MRVFVDTNVLLDVLPRCEPHFTDAARLWSLAESGRVGASISPVTLERKEGRNVPDQTESLRGYGAPIFERDGWVCQYCGFDGRTFEGWLFLTVDHVVPTAQGGTDDPENLVTACRACNSFCNQLEVPNDREQALEEKRRAITLRRGEYLRWWLQNVLPRQ